MVKSSLVVAVALLGGAVFADTVNWTGPATGGKWVAANFTDTASANRLPTASDTVVFSGISDVEVEEGVAAVIGGLDNLPGDGVRGTHLTISGDGTLTLGATSTKIKTGGHVTLDLVVAGADNCQLVKADYNTINYACYLYLKRNNTFTGGITYTTTASERAGGTAYSDANRHSHVYANALHAFGGQKSDGSWPTLIQNDLQVYTVELTPESDRVVFPYNVDGPGANGNYMTIEFVFNGRMADLEMSGKCLVNATQYNNAPFRINVNDCYNGAGVSNLYLTGWVTNRNVNTAAPTRNLRLEISMGNGLYRRDPTTRLARSRVIFMHPLALDPQMPNVRWLASSGYTAYYFTQQDNALRDFDSSTGSDSTAACGAYTNNIFGADGIPMDFKRNGDSAQRLFLDLNGFDQVLSRCFSHWVKAAWSLRPWIYTPTGKPATLTVKGTQSDYLGELDFKGPLSVVWAPTSDSYAWTLTNVTSDAAVEFRSSGGTMNVATLGAQSALVVQTLCASNSGVLNVGSAASLAGKNALKIRATDGGRVVLAPGACSATSVDLVAEDGGTVRVSNADALPPKATYLNVGTTGTLELDEGVTLTVTTGMVRGVALDWDTSYTADDLSGLSGSGTLFVKGVEVETVEKSWDAGGGDDTRVTVAANWEGDETPDLDAGGLIATFATGSLATLDQTVRLRQLKIGAANTPFTIASATGAEKLRVGTSGIRSYGDVMNAVTAPVQLDGSQIIGVDGTSIATSSLTLSGPFSNSGSLANVTKGGNGRLVLSGDSDGYTGAITVTNGVLEFHGAAGAGVTEVRNNVLEERSGSDPYVSDGSKNVQVGFGAYYMAMSNAVLDCDYVHTYRHNTVSGHPRILYYNISNPALYSRKASTNVIGGKVWLKRLESDYDYRAKAGYIFSEEGSLLTIRGGLYTGELRLVGYGAFRIENEPFDAELWIDCNSDSNMAHNRWKATTVAIASQGNFSIIHDFGDFNVTCETNDVFLASTALVLKKYHYYNQSIDYHIDVQGMTYVDMNGFDQRIGDIYTSNCTNDVYSVRPYPAYSSNCVWRSKAPATLTVNQSTSQVNYNLFEGQVSVRLVGGASTVWTLGRPSATTGTLECVSGTLALGADAAFPHNTGLAVGAAGRIRVANTANLPRWRHGPKRNLEIAAGGILELAAGTRLSVHQATCAGVTLKKGTWGAPGSGADHIDTEELGTSVFDGTGVVEVRGGGFAIYLK